MRRCAAGVAMVAVATLGLESLDAQSNTRARPGDRVRVQSLLPSGSFDRGIKGTVEDLSGDSLLSVRSEVADTLILVRSLDYRVRVHAMTGRRSSAVYGTVIGALLGTAGGAIIGLGFANQCPALIADEPPCVEGGPEAKAGAVIGFGGGVVLGTVIGALIKRDAWAPVRGFPSFGPTFTTPSGGAGMGVSFGF